ncbi:FtsX-like permease family protein [Phytomonospora sp. NPDC050363]|uniref:FtsX-like permease family protein n=1 Tax=Phytomonospora sp. NPDC050363 TaxID=3155642 RepID=UPI0034111E0E
MFTFALRTLRSRLAGFVGAFVALMCAAAMVAACGMLLDTGLRGEIPVERYAGAPVVVAGDQEVHWTTTKDKGEGEVKTKTKSKPLTERAWIPADLAGTVAAVPGVDQAVPEVTFPAYLLDDRGLPLPGPEDGDSWGHGIASAPLTPFTVTDGRAPAATGEIALDTELAARAGIGVGQTASVQSTTVPGTYTVVGLVTPEAGDLAAQSTIFFSDEEARALAGHDGQLTAIGVLPSAGTDLAQLHRDLTAALDGTPGEVYAGAARGPLEFVEAEGARVKLLSMGGAIGGTSLLVGVLVVVGTFALSMQQRHREIALLRAIAATPRQMRQLIGREALMVGAIAAPLGAFAGIFLGGWLRNRFVSYGVIPANLDLVVSPFPIAAAVIATLAAAFLAARISARHVIRIRPTEALSDAAMPTPRLGVVRSILGLLALAGGVVLLVVLSGLSTEAAASPVTFFTAILLVVALSLLGPVVARVAAYVFTPLLSWILRAGGYLAAANARTSARRLASVITPLGLLVALTVTILFVPTTMGDAAAGELRDGTKADYTLTAPGPGIPSEAAATVRDLPGVDAATETIGSTVRIGQDKYRAKGVTPEGVSANLDLGVTKGSMDDFAGTSIAMSELAAEQRAASVGDEIDVTMGDGVHVTLTLVAIYERHLGFGDLTLPHEVVAAHVDNPLSSTVLVSGSVTPQDIRTALGKTYPTLAVLGDAEVEEARSTVASTNAEVQLLVMSLVIAFAAIAVVNTLAMATADRAREFALLRLVGTTKRQVMRMLRTETGMAVLIAVVLGTGIAVATLTAFSVGMTGAAQPSMPFVTYATVIAGAALLALVSTVLPGRVALRGRPSDVIGGKQ